MPDSEGNHDPGELEASITFTNQSSATPEAFKTLVEHALESVASSLAGTLESLPGHDDTGVIIGPG